ncbi:hypothetical protein PFLA_a3857 [Pseudoalteromonas flavipulchra NCIMB 2033 = ATCC BAA-314]|nr:hypothetical protein [Pseudoalteromonas flavipulchra NCIMB 2033 = ATCC BAA-314]
MNYRDSENNSMCIQGATEAFLWLAYCGNLPHVQFSVSRYD